jgi:putative oxidoreductase
MTNNSFHIPFPTLSAVLCVYAEFTCGILFIAGLWVRTAALVMIFTFTIAIAVVDIHDGFEKAFPAWTIWAVSTFLLFYGGGKFSVDEKFLNHRRLKRSK